MDFIKLIGIEIKNLLKSKFLLVIGIFVLSLGLLLPVFTNVVSPAISKFIEKRNENKYSDTDVAVTMPAIMYSSYSYSKPYYDGYYGGYNQDPIIVGDVAIDSENPLYWNVSDLITRQNDVENFYMESPAVNRFMMDMLGLQINFYSNAARYIKTYDDYRYSVAIGASYGGYYGWGGYLISNITPVDKLVIKYIYEYEGGDYENLKKAAMNICYAYNFYEEGVFEKMFIGITPEKRAGEIQKIDDYLKNINTIIANADFGLYIKLGIENAGMEIEQLKEQLAAQEQLIIDDPYMEEQIGWEIENIKKQIKEVENITIPMLEYRGEKNILPNTPDWQNYAINDIENNQRELGSTKIMSEEDFMREAYWNMREYGSYQKYVKLQQKKIDNFQNNITVAKKSLDEEKPDMKFVYDGARLDTNTFLIYSIFVAIFAILAGGWSLASEFQLGTIRLLMIRPKTRMKILFSKYASALLVCIGIFIAGSMINLITNGAFKGFKDFTYPNYTVTGSVNFFAYYAPKLLACTIPVIFAFSIAFMLSAVIKNIAVSVILPVVCYIGCTILMQVAAYNQRFYWIAYTPVPYVDISRFFMPSNSYTVIQQMIANGAPLSLTYGIPLMLGLAAAFVILTVVIFRKQDITN